MPISRTNSVALDVLRAAAALTVFLHHCNWLGLDGGWLGWFRRDVGHSAVVIFFVLSGYVIAATLRPGATLRDYAVRRAARVYSVAVPAMLLTIAIDVTLVHWQVPPDSAYELNKPWIYLPMALTFSNDLWALGVPAFSNNPYWSLGYEAWYYAVFGAAAFLRGAWRWVGLGLVLAAMGPKLWLLLPVWLGGVGALWLQRRHPLPRLPSRLLVAACLALFLVVKALHVEDAINALVPPEGLRFSQWFVGDTLVGVLTVALVYALGTAELALGRMRPAVWLAKVSFSLYLTHFPLLLLFAAALPGRHLAPVLLALGCALAFGAVFEPQKDRLRRALMPRPA